MKKLSKVELDVVVNEILNGIRNKEVEKSELILSMNGNKEVYLNKINELELLMDKVNEVKNELREFEKGFFEDGIRVNFKDRNNYYGVNNDEKKYYISLEKGKSNNGNIYNEVYNEVVLSNIDNEFNIKDFIKDFIKKFL